MNQQQFFKALEETDDDFFIDLQGQLRTRERSGKSRVCPITAVARFQGYNGSDINDAVKYLDLDLNFAVKICQIADGSGVYTPTDLKLKAKLMNRTVRRK